MTIQEYVQAKNDDNKELIIKYNAELVEKYPFLECGYFRTWMDNLYDGWRIRFEEEFLSELKQALIEENVFDTYTIWEVKEKFGMMRWYASYSSNRISEIIRKYEQLSYSTCIICGEPAKYMSLGWICSWCEYCAKEEFYQRTGDSIDEEIEFEDEFQIIEEFK